MDVSAAILAGGRGSRLRSVIADRPKVLAPVHGRPYITLLLDQLADASVEEVVLLTGFRAKQVRHVLGQTYAGMRLSYSWEPSPLGTAGAVRWALSKLSGTTVLLLNGDSYCDVDLVAFRDFHAKRAAEISLVLAKASEKSRFGNVWVNRDGRIQRFQEKTERAPDGWINAGIYLLERLLIQEIPVARESSLERDLFPAWVDSKRMFGFRCAGRFLDIGTPEAYAQVDSFFPGLQRS
jgi:D-glycero-alpha-D-manno-heptose 1-phosphate guanylyltransferase